MGNARELALIRIGQVLNELGDGDPGDLGDLRILIIHDAVLKAQQVVVHGLVDAHAIGDEPIINHAEVREDLAIDTGLLPHLALGGELLRLAVLHVAFRHGPQQTAAAIQPADERHVDLGEVYVSVSVDGFRQSGHDETARGRLIPRGHAVGGRALRASRAAVPVARAPPAAALGPWRVLSHPC